MTTYDNRTCETIYAEYDQYTIQGVLQLANSLDAWMANKHNGREFQKLAKDMLADGNKPYEVAKALFAHGYDWFAFGN